MTFEDLRPEQIPQHVAIILDGNGRWAKANGKLRSQGHKAGADNVETINDALTEIGAKYLTVYAFSTENWKRAEDEVSYLMSLMKRYLIRNKKDAIARRTRIRVIGDKTRLDPELQELIREVEADTAHLDRFNLTFAINYGGRDEIVRAVRRVALEAKEGRLDPDMIDEALFASYLDTADLPDPDLLIRTSGEERISNFLPWQIAYSELYFAQVYWPDFTVDELKKAILSYAGRERRFGGR
ncbi:MAG: isoprenyl transferase [Firmicutes bacterium]|nr:isoprenyl transferase [Bacillota bacterium]